MTGSFDFRGFWDTAPSRRVSRALQLQAASAVVTAQYTVVFQRALISYYTGELDPAHVSLAE